MLSLLGLGGGEIVLLLAAMLVFLLFAGGIVALIVWLARRNTNTTPPLPPPITKSKRVCPQCGQQLSTDAPQGLCPACLMKVGLGSHFGDATQAPKNPGPAMSGAELGGLFPQLEILELLGQGGMGTVYKARQPGLDRFVALKILSPESSKDPAFAERFSREAKALARLNHPNIVGVYDFGKAGDLFYFIMEYVDGMNLWQLEQSKKRLTPEEAFAIVPKICDALQYAHDEGIVHRDIKPGNILIDKKGRVKIADFGLAKLLSKEPPPFGITQSRVTMGTPQYMAPEQIEKPLDVDHRADIYSLGVVFYEMLTGELPIGRFAAPSEKVQIDVRLDEVVLRALEKEPARRYQQVSEVRTQVDKIAASPGEGTTSNSKPNPDQPRSKPDKSRSWFFKTAAGCLVGIGLLVVGAIAAILLAIVIPAFKHSKAIARATVAASQSAGDSASALSPQQIVERTLEKYKVMTTIAADGKIVTEVRYEDLSTEKIHSISSSFSVQLSKPNLCLLQWKEAITADHVGKGAVWSDGENAFRFVANRKIKEPDLQTALTSVADASGEASSTIPALFFQPGSNWLTRLTDLSGGEDVRLDGEDCYVISGLCDGQNVTLWIQKHDFLLKQRQSVIDGSRIPQPTVTDAQIVQILGGSASPERIENWKQQFNGTYWAITQKKGTKTETFHLIEVNQPMPKEMFSNPALLTSDKTSDELPLLVKVTTNGPAILPRAKASTPNLLDLSSSYNVGLDDAMGSKTLPGNNLANLPRGLQTFDGVRFDVRGIVQLSGEALERFLSYPTAMKEVKVGLKCRRIHLLQGTCWKSDEGTSVANVVLHFVNGTTKEVPVVYGKDLRDFNYISDQVRENPPAVWEGRNAADRIGRIYKMTVENPLPDVEVSSMDYVSTMSNSAPFVIAITVE